LSKGQSIEVREIVRTCDVLVAPDGPEYRIEVFREPRGLYGLRCWRFDLFQVEVPQLTAAARRTKPRKAHPTLLEEGGGFPFDFEKRFRSPAAAVRSFVTAAEDHFRSRRRVPGSGR
jgi:hypothetical protein